VVFGQYRAGLVGGTMVPGYREEPDVAPDSQTETFVAMRLEVANWRWYGVPFFLRTGKRLPRRATQIAVRFRRPPVSIFGNRPTGAGAGMGVGVGVGAGAPNTLIITIQPDEGFDLCFDVKAPGQPLVITSESLRFRYNEKFERLPEAYETLLLDLLLGDQTLYIWSEVVETAWRVYTPLLENRPPLCMYPAGTWGPIEADRLMALAGSEWIVT
jgi:glucose-6-phosphate 1-dehydrogenase